MIISNSIEKREERIIGNKMEKMGIFEKIIYNYNKIYRIRDVDISKRKKLFFYTQVPPESSRMKYYYWVGCDRSPFIPSFGYIDQNKKYFETTFLAIFLYFIFAIPLAIPFIFGSIYLVDTIFGDVFYSFNILGIVAFSILFISIFIVYPISPYIISRQLIRAKYFRKLIKLISHKTVSRL